MATASPLRSTDPAVVLAALQDAQLAAAARLHDLVTVLTTARGRAFGMGTAARRPADEHVVHALVALAAVRVLLDQLGPQRWPWTRDALHLGARLSDVAHVLGLDDDEVRAGYTGWAQREHDAGTLDDTAHADALALLDEQHQTGPERGGTP